MNRSDTRDALLILGGIFLLCVLILVFAAALVYFHEETIQACIEQGMSWTKDTCSTDAKIE